MKKGPYTVLDTKKIYKNPWIEVTEEKVIRPDGKEGIFGLIDYQPGVSVVALSEGNEVYLTKHYLYAIEEYGLELPSGGIDKNETPLDAAKRELLEETGLTSGSWTPLGFVHPFTMIIKSPAHLFLATNVKQEKLTTDSEEGLEIKKVPFEEAHAMVLENKITHAQSCVGLLKAKAYFDRNTR